jgi:sugar/nucleoside kinase (ribokinase family)
VGPHSDFAKMELGGSGNGAVELSLVGGKVAFVGKAGKDFFEKLYAENLEANKVAPELFLDKHSPRAWS